MVITESLLLSRLASELWAVDPRMFEVFSSVMNRKIDGLDIKDSPFLKVVQDEPVDPETDSMVTYKIRDGHGIIPLHGLVMKRSMGMEGLSGFCKTLDVEKTFKAALADDRVEKIVLDMDSPGGTVAGSFELADSIYNARGQKPIIGYANGMMCSAMYLIGSAADEIYCGPTSIVGSIGVYATHVDRSEQLKDRGIKISYIQAGKYKTVGAPDKPLSKFDKDTIQARIDYGYSMFVDYVSRHLGVEAKKVDTDMADGRIFMGQQAVDVGLVNSLRTFDDLFATKPSKYSFLKGVNMFDAKLKDAGYEDLCKERPDLVEKAQADVKNQLEATKKDLAQADEAVVKAGEDLEKEKNNSKILIAAVKAGLVAKGEELIKEGVPYAEAMEKLLEEKSSHATVSHNDFIETSSDPAGNAETSSIADDEPKTQTEARDFIMARDGISKGKASIQAHKEFPHLWGETSK